ncbi:MAG TPA: helix-turn-helix domain-containing protein [Gemmatimonadales bacterium]
MPLDLTPFGFTPTESLIYEVLVTKGPGTGYAVARSAGLARANAYSALEGLVTKGAARVDEGRPKRFRPEPPSVLLGRIADRQGQAIDALSEALSTISLPATPTLTEASTFRGVIQLLSLEIARARSEVLLCLPAEAYQQLAPALRRAIAGSVSFELSADGPADQTVAPVQSISPGTRWPGRPLLAAIDGRAALIGLMEGDRVSAHWGTAPAMVAAAILGIRSLAA